MLLTGLWKQSILDLMLSQYSEIDEEVLKFTLRLGIKEMSKQSGEDNPSFEKVYLEGEPIEAKHYRDLYVGIAKAIVLFGHDWVLLRELSSDEYRSSLEHLPPRDEKYSREGSFRSLGNGRHIYVKPSAKNNWDKLLTYVGGQSSWFDIHLRSKDNSQQRN